MGEILGLEKALRNKEPVGGDKPSADERGQAEQGSARKGGGAAPPERGSGASHRGAKPKRQANFYL